MLDRLTKLREERANSDKGFTLIELLVVVVIIGILIAIAIPLYLNYTKGANDKAAESDLRGAISTMEQYNSDNSNYPTGLTQGGSAPKFTYTITGSNPLIPVNVSSGTTLKYLPSTAAAPTGYMIESQSSTGSKSIFCYSSATGGSVRKVTSTTTLAASYPAGGVCPT